MKQVITNIKKENKELATSKQSILLQGNNTFPIIEESYQKCDTFLKSKKPFPDWATLICGSLVTNQS